MSARILAWSAFAVVLSSALGRAQQVLGPSPYTSVADSPFSAASFQGYFFRETFEDGLFNVPGVSASAGTVFSNGVSTDSVDADDGSIDGSGLMGHSLLFNSTGNPDEVFHFNPNLLGAYPSHVGIVATDAFNPVFIEAFKVGGGTLSGVVSITTFGPAPDVQGQTGEDRFVGFVFDGGIQSLRVATLGGGGLEVDHLQYGLLQPLPATIFCKGDATGTPCPCGNYGSAGHGCANSVHAAGGSLTAHGMASVSNDTLTLVGTSMPDTVALYLRGTTQVNGGNGLQFGDGLRCVGGTVVRMYLTSNAGGTSTCPSASGPPVSVMGGALAGSPLHYQVWYRNPAAYCTMEPYNLTNGLRVNWLP